MDNSMVTGILTIIYREFKFPTCFKMSAFPEIADAIAKSGDRYGTMK